MYAKNLKLSVVWPVYCLLRILQVVKYTSHLFSHLNLLLILKLSHVKVLENVIFLEITAHFTTILTASQRFLPHSRPTVLSSGYDLALTLSLVILGELQSKIWHGVKFFLILLRPEFDPRSKLTPFTSGIPCWPQILNLARVGSISTTHPKLTPVNTIYVP